MTQIERINADKNECQSKRLRLRAKRKEQRVRLPSSSHCLGLRRIKHRTSRWGKKKKVEAEAKRKEQRANSMR